MTRFKAAHRPIEIIDSVTRLADDGRKSKQKSAADMSVALLIYVYFSDCLPFNPGLHLYLKSKENAS